MKKSRFKPPYLKGEKKTAFPKIQNKSGVYLVKSIRTGDIVYIGYSGSNIYKTMYRHFQSWNDPTQTRVTYPKKGYIVRVVLTTPKRAQWLERALILKYKPKDNPDKLELFQASKKEVKKMDDLKDDYFGEAITDMPF